MDHSELDAEALVKALDSHGPFLESLLHLWGKPDVVELLDSVKSRVDFKSHRRLEELDPSESVDDARKIKLCAFVAQKSGFLFRKIAPPRNPIALTRESLDNCAVMPPVEKFLNQSRETRRAAFFDEITPGDVVICQIRGVDKWGVRVAIMSFELPKKKEIWDLQLRGWMFHEESKKKLMDLAKLGFEKDDYVRCRVTSFSETDKRVFLTLGHGPEDAGAGLGKMLVADLPLSFRRCLTPEADTYDDLLCKIREFRNPKTVDVLLPIFGLRPTARCSLLGFPERNSYSVAFLEDLRQKQASLTASIYVGLGFDELRLKNFDKALQCFQSAIAVDPTDVEARLARGALYVNRMQLEEAIADFSQVLDSKPDHENAKNYLSNAVCARARELAEENRHLDALELIKNHMKPLSDDAQVGQVLREIRSAIEVESKPSNSARSPLDESAETTNKDDRDVEVHSDWSDENSPTRRASEPRRSLTPPRRLRDILVPWLEARQTTSSPEPEVSVVTDPTTTSAPEVAAPLSPLAVCQATSDVKATLEVLQKTPLIFILRGMGESFDTEMLDNVCDEYQSNKKVRVEDLYGVKFRGPPVDIRAFATYISESLSMPVGLPDTGVVISPSPTSTVDANSTKTGFTPGPSTSSKFRKQSFRDVARSEEQPSSSRANAQQNEPSGVQSFMELTEVSTNEFRLSRLTDLVSTDTLDDICDDLQKTLRTRRLSPSDYIVVFSEPEVHIFTFATHLSNALNKAIFLPEEGIDIYPETSETNGVRQSNEGEERNENFQGSAEDKDPGNDGLDDSVRPHYSRNSTPEPFLESDGEREEPSTNDGSRHPKRRRVTSPPPPEMPLLGGSDRDNFQLSRSESTEENRQSILDVLSACLARTPPPPISSEDTSGPDNAFSFPAPPSRASTRFEPPPSGPRFDAPSASFWTGGTRRAPPLEPPVQPFPNPRPLHPADSIPPLFPEFSRPHPPRRSPIEMEDFPAPRRRPGGLGPSNYATSFRDERYPLSRRLEIVDPVMAEPPGSIEPVRESRAAKRARLFREREMEQGGGGECEERGRHSPPTGRPERVEPPSGNAESVRELNGPQKRRRRRRRAAQGRVESAEETVDEGPVDVEAIIGELSGILEKMKACKGRVGDEFLNLASLAKTLVVRMKTAVEGGPFANLLFQLESAMNALISS